MLQYLHLNLRRNDAMFDGEFVDILKNVYFFNNEDIVDLVVDSEEVDAKERYIALTAHGYSYLSQVDESILRGVRRYIFQNRRIKDTKNNIYRLKLIDLKAILKWLKKDNLRLAKRIFKLHPSELKALEIYLINLVKD